MNLKDELVSIQEATHILNLDRSRIGRLCRQGRFEGAAKIGSTWIIPREALLNHKPLKRGVKPKRLLKVINERKILKEALMKIKESNENNDS